MRICQTLVGSLAGSLTILCCSSSLAFSKDYVIFELERSSFFPFYSEAYDDFQSGHFKKAERILKRAVKLEKFNNSDLSFDVAACEYMQHSYKTALPIFLSVSTDCLDAHFFAASCYEYLGQTADAIQHYKLFLSNLRFPPPGVNRRSQPMCRHRPIALSRLEKLDPQFNALDYPKQYFEVEFKEKETPRLFSPQSMALIRKHQPIPLVEEPPTDKPFFHAFKKTNELVKF